MLNVEDDNILQFGEMFRNALREGVTPEDFSESLLAQFGPMVAGSLVREVPLDRVKRVLSAAPTADSDVLLRRDGQQFLQKVWESVEEAT